MRVLKQAGLELRLPYRPPYHWGALLSFLGPRLIPGLERIEEETYFRVLDDGAPGVVRIRHDPEDGALVASLPASLASRATALSAMIRKAFDLDTDPAALSEVFERDPTLGDVWGRNPGLRVPGCWDPFELSVRAILGQQVSVRGATTMAGSLVQRWGREAVSGDPSLRRLFPLPSALIGAPLEEIGLTRARAETIRLLAAAVQSGRVSLDPSVPRQQFFEAITSIPGIGDWTAQYIAMRALGDSDAFPASDLGLRKATGNITPRQLLLMAEGWRPWRAYAAMLLWRSL